METDRILTRRQFLKKALPGESDAGLAVGFFAGMALGGFMGGFVGSAMQDKRVREEMGDCSPTSTSGSQSNADQKNK